MSEELTQVILLGGTSGIIMVSRSRKQNFTLTGSGVSTASIEMGKDGTTPQTGELQLLKQGEQGSSVTLLTEKHTAHADSFAFCPPLNSLYLKAA